MSIADERRSTIKCCGDKDITLAREVEDIEAMEIFGKDWIDADGDRETSMDRQGLLSF